MTLSEAKAGGWSSEELLTSAQMNALQSELIKAVDGAGGGTYTLTAPLIFSGDDVRFDSDDVDIVAGGELSVLASATLAIESSGLLLVEAGGQLIVQSSGLMQVAGDLEIVVGGNLNVESGGALDILSGGALDVQSGARLDIESGGEIAVLSGGAATVESGGALDVEGGGQIDVQSGARIDVESGGELDILSGGLLTVSSGGDINVESGGTATIASGGVLDVNGTLDVSLVGALVVDGDLTVGASATFSIDDQEDIQITTPSIRTGLISTPHGQPDNLGGWGISATTRLWTQTDVSGTRRVYFPVAVSPGDVVEGCIVRIDGGTAHSNVPATPPSVNLLEISNDGGVTLLGSTTDAPGSVGAYEVLHNITVGGALGHTVSASSTIVIAVNGEQGTDSLANQLSIASVQVQYRRNRMRQTQEGL